MNFPFFVARRYLFSKKSHHTINIISGISVCGVALATIALICTLSVFNGFQDMVADLFTAFDPQLKVVLAEGRHMKNDDPKLKEIRKDQRIEMVSESLEDQALLSYGGRQMIATIKGVDNNFQDLADFGNLLYGEGRYKLGDGLLNYGILGLQLSHSLGVGASYENPMQVFAPKKGERINMGNPAASFTQSEFISPGVVFAVKQNKYDANYALVSLNFAQELFNSPGEITALEIRCKDGVNEKSVKKDLQKILGSRYKVMDRYEQQADIFRIMEIEKLLSYVFLTFILVVACFNIIGSLSMLILDKKADVQTLRNLGVDDSQVCKIFLFEGRMISFFGAALGLIIGLGICWGQMQFGWLKLGKETGDFLVDAYPVSVHFWDVVLVFVTVVIVGYLSVWYPVRYLSRRLLG